MTSISRPPSVFDASSGRVAKDFAGYSGAATSTVARKVYARQVVADELKVEAQPVTLFSGIVSNPGGSPTLSVALFLSIGANSIAITEDIDDASVIEFVLPCILNKLTLSTATAGILHLLHARPYIWNATTNAWVEVAVTPASDYPTNPENGHTTTIVLNTALSAGTRFKLALRGLIPDSWPSGASMFVSVHANM